MCCRMLMLTSINLRVNLNLKELSDSYNNKMHPKTITNQTPSTSTTFFTSKLTIIVSNKILKRMTNNSNNINNNLTYCKFINKISQNHQILHVISKVRVRVDKYLGMIKRRILLSKFRQNLRIYEYMNDDLIIYVLSFFTLTNKIC